MNRREFFARLGIAIAAPFVAQAIPRSEPLPMQFDLPAEIWYRPELYGPQSAPRVLARIHITAKQIEASRHAPPGAFRQAIIDDYARAHHAAVADLHRRLVETSALPLR